MVPDSGLRTAAGAPRARGIDVHPVHPVPDVHRRTASPEGILPQRTQRAAEGGWPEDAPTPACVPRFRRPERASFISPGQRPGTSGMTHRRLKVCDKTVHVTPPWFVRDYRPPPVAHRRADSRPSPPLAPLAPRCGPFPSGLPVVRRLSRPAGIQAAKVNLEDRPAVARVGQSLNVRVCPFCIVVTISRTSSPTWTPLYSSTGEHGRGSENLLGPPVAAWTLR